MSSLAIGLWVDHCAPSLVNGKSCAVARANPPRFVSGDEQVSWVSSREDLLQRGRGTRTLLTVTTSRPGVA
jgi:hypothetical protein